MPAILNAAMLPTAIPAIAPGLRPGEPFIALSDSSNLLVKTYSVITVRPGIIVELPEPVVELPGTCVIVGAV